MNLGSPKSPWPSRAPWSKLVDFDGVLVNHRSLVVTSSMTNRVLEFLPNPPRRIIGRPPLTTTMTLHLQRAGANGSLIQWGTRIEAYDWARVALEDSI